MCDRPWRKANIHISTSRLSSHVSCHEKFFLYTRTRTLDRVTHLKHLTSIRALSFYFYRLYVVHLFIRRPRKKVTDIEITKGRYDFSCHLVWLCGKIERKYIYYVVWMRKWFWTSDTSWCLIYSFYTILPKNFLLKLKVGLLYSCMDVLARITFNIWSQKIIAHTHTRCLP